MDLGINPWDQPLDSTLGINDEESNRNKERNNKKAALRRLHFHSNARSGVRTLDTLIKSQVLCQLS